MIINNRDRDRDKKQTPGLPVPIPHRRPLDPKTVMASTGRVYKIVVPMTGKRTLTIEQWSPDNKRGELNKVWGVKATLEVV